MSPEFCSRISDVSRLAFQGICTPLFSFIRHPVDLNPVAIVVVFPSRQICDRRKSDRAESEGRTHATIYLTQPVDDGRVSLCALHVSIPQPSLMHAQQPPCLFVKQYLRATMNRQIGELIRSITPPPLYPFSVSSGSRKNYRRDTRRSF